MAGIRDNQDAARFEMDTDWGLATLAYHHTPEAISLDHAEVPPDARGRGVASAFVRGVLDMLRAENRRVIPRCGYVRHIIRSHPGYAQLTRS
ncbi:GNAT family N-acetyltransferase [Camelimonas abortus]|uniref:GNAT family N-acetyltransferase n=1 Tax=Camelimonas abortus TaxID=1017184 RepID=A0ABV7LEL1_9HYPH